MQAEVSGERRDRPFLFQWRGAIAASELTSTAKLVAWTLSHHMDGKGGSCWPSIALLAREASLAESTVHEAVKVLDAQGFVDRMPGGGRGRSTRYQATLPQAETLRESDALAGKGTLRHTHVNPPTDAPKPSGSRRGGSQEEAREDATAVARVREATGGGERDPFLEVLACLPLAPRSGAELDVVRQAYRDDAVGLEHVVDEVLRLPGIRNPFGLVYRKVQAGEHLHVQKQVKVAHEYTRAFPEGTCDGCGAEQVALVDERYVYCAECSAPEAVAA